MLKYSCKKNIAQSLYNAFGLAVQFGRILPFLSAGWSDYASGLLQGYQYI